MEITVDSRQDVAIIGILVKELDASNVGEFKHAMSSILETSSKVVIDLSLLQFVDSSGLGALLSCLRQMTAKEGDLKLCGMTRQVRATFELVRMHRIFDIRETREEAVQAFNAARPVDVN
jgi:anti-sigma B factor antagonist